MNDKSHPFTPSNTLLDKAKAIIAKYPQGRESSAIMPLLDLAQRENGGWLSVPAMEWVANTVNVAYMRVYEVASFYTMYNLKPVGKHFVQVCRTTPCWLRGSDALSKVCQEKIGDKSTINGDFSWIEVECLGACCNAPMVQINDDYYEDLDSESFTRILDDLAAGKEVQPGSQTGRKGSKAL